MPSSFFTFDFSFVCGTSIITDSTYRIVNNGREFAKAAPFTFDLQNKRLEVPQFEDYKLDFKVSGKTLPNEVSVEIDGFQYKAEKLSNEEFSFLFRNVQKDLPFKIVSGSVASEPHILHIIPKPSLSGFSVHLQYLTHTGRSHEKNCQSG